MGPGAAGWQRELRGVEAWGEDESVGQEVAASLRAPVQTPLGLWARTGSAWRLGVRFGAGAHPCPRWGCGTE